MKKHRLLKITISSPIYAQLGGHHMAETIPIMYSSPHNLSLKATKPKEIKVATRIRLSEGKPKKFFK